MLLLFLSLTKKVLWELKINDFLLLTNIILLYNNYIYFICNGFKIKKQESRTLAQMGYINGTVILVIDKKGIMGA